MEGSTDDTIVATAAATSPHRPDASAGEAAVLRAGEKLGRYLVLEVLGAGAMGVVYAAFDPELDRRVAIKYLLGGETRDDPQAALCSGAEAQLGEVWNPDVREQLRAQLAGLPVDYAEPTSERVSAALDDYAAAWTSMHREACEAARVRGEQSVHVLDLRMACLDRRKHELATLAELLASADRELLDRSIQAVGSLSPISACAELDALGSVTPPPASGELRARVDEIRRVVARVRALRLAAKYDEAVELAEETETHLPSEYPPVAAELGRAKSDALVRLGAYDEAVTTYRRAHLTALRHRDLATASSSLSGLAFVTGYIQRDYEPGLERIEQALALAEATGDELLIAQVSGQEGVIHHGHGKVDLAIPPVRGRDRQAPRGRAQLPPRAGRAALQPGHRPPRRRGLARGAGRASPGRGALRRGSRRHPPRPDRRPRRHRHHLGQARARRGCGGDRGVAGRPRVMTSLPKARAQLCPRPESSASRLIQSQYEPTGERLG